MGVSKNRDTPKCMVNNGKPYSNGWIGGTTIFGNIQIASASVFGPSSSGLIFINLPQVDPSQSVFIDAKALKKKLKEDLCKEPVDPYPSHGTGRHIWYISRYVYHKNQPSCKGAHRVVELTTRSRIRRCAVLMKDDWLIIDLLKDGP